MFWDVWLEALFSIEAVNILENIGFNNMVPVTK
jgi:hypothetical protein